MKLLVAYRGSKPPDEYENVAQITTSAKTGGAILTLGDKNEGEEIELSDVKTTTLIED